MELVWIDKDKLWPLRLPYCNIGLSLAALTLVAGDGLHHNR